MTTEQVEQAWNDYAKEYLFPYAPKGDDVVWDMPEYRRQIDACKKAFFAGSKVKPINEKMREALEGCKKYFDNPDGNYGSLRAKIYEALA